MPAYYTLNLTALTRAARAAGDTADNGDPSPTRISKRTGVDRGQISRHLRGESRPDLDTLIALARAYGRNYSDFVLLADTEEAA